jgi:predicted negative regulator of RcsB-dependent stress response|tara:strand:- start:1413 stop:2057 length:645 start_codon:yes stop_codon:yes gene_type:complete
MNNIYENNMKFLPFLKFLDKYKKVLIAIVILILIIISFLIISNQIQKENNESASIIYNDWIEEISQEIPNIENLDTILNKLVTEYPKTGYTQLALLNKANLDAKLENLDNSLMNFKKLIDLTDGLNGNKIFNKMSRVSSARILLSLDKHEEALEMIKVFSSSNTNGYIHELTGDILVKQEKNDLAKAQYDIALKKYSDETSKSIVSMKIANIGT